MDRKERKLRKAIREELRRLDEGTPLTSTETLNSFMSGLKIKAADPRSSSKLVLTLEGSKQVMLDADQYSIDGIETDAQGAASHVTGKIINEALIRDGGSTVSLWFEDRTVTRAEGMNSSPEVI